MSTRHRHPSYSSSKSSSLAKRHGSSTENMVKVLALSSQVGKKRASLGNITNQKNAPANIASEKILVPCSALVPSPTKLAKLKKGPAAYTRTTENSRNNLHASLNIKSSLVASSKATSFPLKDESVHRFPAAIPTSGSMDISPSKSDDMSVSMDETMSTCDSSKRPDVEYIDNNDIVYDDYIDNSKGPTGNNCNREILVEMEIDNEIVNVDTSSMNPQFCTTYASDIYWHLRASEARKMPVIDFMERVQKDINPRMRAVLIDWLVEVAEEYRLVPDTLYLTVNYIDRYLSGNSVNRRRLQLLGVACMMIASKYEEICAPQVEEFCYITDNTYFKYEVLQMESSVLNYLKFEMASPTVKCFLRQFIQAAQGIDEIPSLQLECLTNYIAELSLLEYNMLCYAPSLIAASSMFLAYFILDPSKRPWNSTLQHYNTRYQPSDLCGCVKELHRLFCSNHNSSLPAVREKYSQHKYRYVTEKSCPPSIPAEYFQNCTQ